MNSIVEEHERKNYLISVDGSNHSEWGFDLIFKEIYQKNDYITVIHVLNPNKNDVPFKYQPEQIMTKYESKLIGKLSKNDFVLIRKPRDNTSEHALQVVNEVAKKNNTDMIIIGTQGHKGVKSKKEVSKGIMYIVKNIHIPSLVIKENSQREKKENKAFTWLICLENHYTRSYKTFEFVTTLIAREKDIIIGLNLWQIDHNRELEDIFEKFCSKMGIKNRRFLSIEKNPDLSIGKNICDIVNFGDDFIDFVSIGHNISKYSEPDTSPTIEIIKYARANILFSSKAQ
jgi:hypothetical protein